MRLLLLMLLLPATALALDNDYVRVTRNAVTCPKADMPGCGDRVIVALDDIEIFVGYAKRNLSRGEIIVFESERAFPPPVGEFFEVVIKPDHPPVLSPPEIIAPEKNAMLYEGERFFVFEEKLAAGTLSPERAAVAPQLIIGQRIDAALAFLFAVILWVVIIDMLRMSMRIRSGKPVLPLSESTYTRTQLDESMISAGQHA